MKTKTGLIVALATMLVAGSAFGADDDAPSDLDARLEAAREQLSQAAHDVGELTAEMGRPFVQRLQFMPQRRAIIGVQLDPKSSKEGARVDRVSPGGPAATAGIRDGDVIVSVNGKTLGDDPVREVTRLIAGVQPESTVKLRVLRDGKPMNVDVVARKPPREEAFTFTIPEPPEGIDSWMDFRQGWRGPVSGMEVATLTPKLGRYFGTEEGVLVVRAPEEDALKLEDGDVILSIDGRKPTSGSHATRILRSYQPGEKLNMRIMRDRKTLDLAVTLPEHPRERRVREMREERDRA